MIIYIGKAQVVKVPEKVVRKIHMNIEAIKADLQALCEKHKVIIYADDENTATVIEQLLAAEEAEGGCPPERFSFYFANYEQVKESLWWNRNR
jgi:hypothetical protein